MAKVMKGRIFNVNSIEKTMISQISKLNDVGIKIG